MNSVSIVINNEKGCLPIRVICDKWKIKDPIWVDCEGALGSSFS